MSKQDWADGTAGKRDFIVSLITHDFFPRMTTLEREVWLNNNKKYIDDKVSVLDSLIRSSAPDSRAALSETKAVCEWDADNYPYWNVSCMKVAPSTSFIEMGTVISDFKFCPYCGLPISVKEK